MADKPTPRIIRRGEEPDGESRVIRSAASDSETFSAVLSNGRTITFREIMAGDLLYLEKSLGNLGDMERSLKLASRVSTGEGRWTFEDLQRLKMRDLRVVTDLLAKAGDNDDEDEDDYPNE